MKKCLLFLFFLLMSSAVFSQVFNPVKWVTKVEKTSDTDYTLITTAIIENGWHVYAQEVPKGGPRPTIFDYKQNTDYKLVGTTVEENGHTGFDETFKMTIKYFKNRAVFKQRITAANPSFKIDAEVEFMACNDVRCLPPKVETLTFSTNPQTANNNGNDAVKNSLSDEQANALLYGISDDYFQKPPVDLNAIDTTQDEDYQSSESKSLWSIFLIAFLSGFAALLTPCVFPMIPMTVSYFTKQSKNRGAGIKNAIIYGLCIISIYVFLGYVITAIFGADALNALSTNVWFNVVFFVILVVFAISFFGYFEITLPSSWSTKIDSQADRSGFIGIFFMALALAVVSFSCTGPIVGTLLVEAASTGGMAPVMGMLGFSLAIALPFALFAAFPGWLNSLPKSGGWMTSVKVVLGFLELALAFKFLSNADLVAHWGILRYEAFLLIWILIFGALTLYLFKIIKFPHDSATKKIPLPKLVLGVLFGAFTLYLALGFRINPKTAIYKPLGGVMSGLLPAVNYNYFLDAEKEPLTIFKDLKEGLAYAKKENKTIMLDFTGYACVNCRKMEENIWPIDFVDKELRTDLVIISLYVDDKKELPKEQQVIVNDIDGSTRKLKNYGHKWSHFQAKFFNTNSQPYYVLVSPDGKQIANKPVGYVPDADKYSKWLIEGKKNAQKSTSLDNLFQPTQLIN